MKTTKKQAREIIAKEFSKNWYQINNKKYYLDVYYCPETQEIQIGEKPSYEKLLGNVQDIYALWKCLTRQMIWNYSLATVYIFLEDLAEQQADVDGWIREIMDWDFKLKKKNWIRFSGGSER